MSTLSIRETIELFHLYFLRHLEERVGKNLYAVKGGCNLRFFFRSIRYSEDLDLDIKTIAVETLRKNVRKILNSNGFGQILDTKGIQIETISEPKQTETTQRWKLLLRKQGLHLPLHTKIEFSRRTFEKETAVEAISPELIRHYEIYQIFCCHYTGAAAIRQKVNALMGRPSTQTRDVFDLKLLLDAGIDTPKISDMDKKQIRDAIESLPYKQFHSQVVSYLSDEYKKIYASEDMWQQIQSFVSNQLCGGRP